MDSLALLVYLVLGGNLLYRVLIRAFQGWRLHLGLLVEYGLLLALYGWFFHAGVAYDWPFVVLSVCLFSLVMPLAWALQRLSAALAGHDLFGPARILALLAFFLAWSRENLFLFQFFTGLDLHQAGRLAEAEAWFERIVRKMPSEELRGAAVGQLVAIHAAARRWRQVSDVHERFRGGFEGEVPPDTLAQIVRGHAEVGRFERALECLRELEARPGAAESATLGRIFLFALAGEPEIVRHTFADQTEHVEEWPSCMCPYWIGRAHLAAGRYAEAGVLLRQALEAVPLGTLAWRRAIDEQLQLAENPEPPLPKHVDPAVREAIAEHGSRRLQTSKAPAFASLVRQRKFHPVTTALLAACIVVHYLIENATGSANPYTLMRFGAMSRALVFGDGEWWRFVSHMFTHGGLIHILSNGYFLYAIGNLLEEFYGGRKILFIYLLSGLAGAGLSLALQSYRIPMVGASGAIMGLLGCAITFAIRHKRQIPPRVRKDLIFNFIVVFALIVGSGFVFNRWSPGGLVIDNWAHLGGGIAGLLLAMFVTPERYVEERNRRYRLGARLMTAVSAFLLLWGGGSMVVNAAGGGYPAREVAMVPVERSAWVAFQAPRFWELVESDSHDYVARFEEPWDFEGTARLDVEVRDQTAEDTFADICERDARSDLDQLLGRERVSVGQERPTQWGAPIEAGGRSFLLFAQPYTLRRELDSFESSVEMVRRYYYFRTDEGVAILFLFEFRKDLEEGYEQLIERILSTVRRSGSEKNS